MESSLGYSPRSKSMAGYSADLEVLQGLATGYQTIMRVLSTG